jgi:hypothetical protein
MMLSGKRLESAEVVDPRQQKRRDQVFFDATVTYATEDGTENTITIVGIDEADFARGQVSWVSPIPRALMKAREGHCRNPRPRRRRAARSARNPLRRRRWRDMLKRRSPGALWQASPRAPRVGPLRHGQAARRLRQSRVFAQGLRCDPIRLRATPPLMRAVNPSRQDASAAGIGALGGHPIAHAAREVDKIFPPSGRGRNLTQRNIRLRKCHGFRQWHFFRDRLADALI